MAPGILWGTIFSAPGAVTRSSPSVTGLAGWFIGSDFFGGRCDFVAFLGIITMPICLTVINYYKFTGNYVVISPKTLIAFFLDFYREDVSTFTSDKNMSQLNSDTFYVMD